MAEGVHLVKAKVRLLSSALTATIANPVLSILEDIVAVISTVLAFVVPILVLGAAALLLFFGGFWIFRRRRKRLA